MYRIQHENNSTRGFVVWYRDHVCPIFDVPVPVDKDKVQGSPAHLMTQGVRGVRESWKRDSFFARVQRSPPRMFQPE